MWPGDFPIKAWFKVTNKGKNTKLFKSRSRGTTQSHSHKHTMTETENTHGFFSKENCCHRICNAWKEKGGGGGLYIHKGLVGTVTYSAGRRKIINNMKYREKLSGEKDHIYRRRCHRFLYKHNLCPPTLFPMSSEQSSMEYLLKQTTCFLRFNYLQGGGALGVWVRLCLHVSASTQCSCNHSTGLHNPCVIPAKLGGGGLWGDFKQRDVKCWSEQRGEMWDTLTKQRLLKSNI